MNTPDPLPSIRRFTVTLTTASFTRDIDDDAVLRSSEPVNSNPVTVIARTEARASELVEVYRWQLLPLPSVIVDDGISVDDLVTALVAPK